MAFALEQASAPCRGGNVAGSRVALLSWCPTMDVAAVVLADATVALPATSSHFGSAHSADVLVYRSPSWALVATLRARAHGLQQHTHHQHHADGHTGATSGSNSNTGMAESDGECATSLAWRPDGKVLCVGRRSGAMTLFCAETGEVVFCPELHSCPVVCLEWSIHGGNSERRLDLAFGSNAGANAARVHAASMHNDSGTVGSGLSPAQGDLEPYLPVHFGYEKATDDSWNSPSNDANFVDLTSHALLPLPPLDTDHSRAGGFQSTHIRDSDVAISSAPRLDVLVSSDVRGRVCISVQGTLCVIELELSGHPLAVRLSEPVAVHVCMAADLQNILLTVQHHDPLVETAVNPPSNPGNILDGHSLFGNSVALVTLDVSAVLGAQSARLRVLAQQLWRLSAAQHHATHTLKAMRQAWSSASAAIAPAFEKLTTWMGASQVCCVSDALDNYLFVGRASLTTDIATSEDDVVTQFLMNTTSTAALRRVRKAVLMACTEQLRHLTQHLRPACFQLAFRVSQLQKAAKLEQFFPPHSGGSDSHRAEMSSAVAHSESGPEKAVLLDYNSLKAAFSIASEFALSAESALRDAVQLRQDLDTLFVWLILERSVRDGEWPPPHLADETTAKLVDHHVGLDTVRLHEFLAENAVAEDTHVATRTFGGKLTENQRASFFAGLHKLEVYINQDSADEKSLQRHSDAFRSSLTQVRSSTRATLSALATITNVMCLSNSPFGCQVAMFSPPANWDVGVEFHLAVAQAQGPQAGRVFLLRWKARDDQWIAQGTAVSALEDPASNVKTSSSGGGNYIKIDGDSDEGTCEEEADDNDAAIINAPAARLLSVSGLHIHTDHRIIVAACVRRSPTDSEGSSSDGDSPLRSVVPRIVALKYCSSLEHNVKLRSINSEVVRASLVSELSVGQSPPDSLLDLLAGQQTDLSAATMSILGARDFDQEFSVDNEFTAVCSRNRGLAALGNGSAFLTLVDLDRPDDDGDDDDDEDAEDTDEDEGEGEDKVGDAAADRDSDCVAQELGADMEDE